MDVVTYVKTQEADGPMDSEKRYTKKKMIHLMDGSPNCGGPTILLDPVEAASCIKQILITHVLACKSPPTVSSTTASMVKIRSIHLKEHSTGTAARVRRLAQLVVYAIIGLGSEPGIIEKSDCEGASVWFNNKTNPYKLLSSETEIRMCVLVHNGHMSRHKSFLTTRDIAYVAELFFAIQIAVATVEQFKRVQKLWVMYDAAPHRVFEDSSRGQKRRLALGLSDVMNDGIVE